MIDLKQYFARNGSRFSNEDAKIIGPELEKLSKQGKSKAEDIVEVAKDKNNPLHEYFEWNNDRAADLYRKGQARTMAGSITIKYEDPETKEEYEVRAFHAIDLSFEKQPLSEKKTKVKKKKKENKSYIQIEQVSENDIYSKQIIEQAKKRLIYWKEKYEQYRSIFPEFEEEYGEIFKAIENVTETNEKEVVNL